MSSMFYHIEMKSEWTNDLSEYTASVGSVGSAIDEKRLGTQS